MASKSFSTTHQFADHALRFFFQKQTYFVFVFQPYNRVRSKMERQVNNNSNFITIYSSKYLQAQKTKINFYLDVGESNY